MPAAYVALLESGELHRRATLAEEQMHACDLCPRACRADRYAGRGECGTGARAVVSSHGAHHGEEDPLRGSGGSGTIFFAHCNLRCRFCQNHSISHGGQGREATPGRIADMMLDVQEAGCHNVNLVSPSHVVAPILRAVAIAAERGLRVPLVYNTGGYDALATLAMLDGVVDIYMPDMKYSDAAVALELSGVERYPDVNRAAVREMHRQVGDLVLDDRGVARRGLLVRHLVLPGGLAGTQEIARFLATEISRDTYVNVMAQYHPAHRAHDHAALSRRITRREHEEAVRICRDAGLSRFD